MEFDGFGGTHNKSGNVIVELESANPCARKLIRELIENEHFHALYPHTGVGLGRRLFVLNSRPEEARVSS